MENAVRRVVPMTQVASVRRSVEFYRALGFSVRGEFVADGASEPSWACVESGDARIMLSAAEGPIDADRQAVLFYLYFPDVEAVHATLAERGLPVGPVEYPFYSPAGEFSLSDPDGYRLVLTHE
jgi:Glyoxalase/Bleomycin resistance protein/Dioxygenase superfamily